MGCAGLTGELSLPRGSLQAGSVAAPDGLRGVLHVGANPGSLTHCSEAHGGSPAPQGVRGPSLRVVTTSLSPHSCCLFFPTCSHQRTEALPPGGAGAGPSPGTVPSSAAIAGLGPRAPSSAPLWERWRCYTHNKRRPPHCSARSLWLCLASSAFLPSSSCPASLWPGGVEGLWPHCPPWGGTPWLLPV